MDEYPHPPTNSNWVLHYQNPPPSSASSASLPRSSSRLSLSISTLSVASSTGARSPVTPLSPGFRYAPPELAPTPNDEISVPIKRSLTSSSMAMSVSVEGDLDDESFIQSQSSPMGYSPGGYGHSSPLYDQTYEPLSQSQHSISQSQTQTHSHSTPQHSPASPSSADDEFRMRTDDEHPSKTGATNSFDEFRVIESHAGNGGVQGVLGKSTGSIGGTNNFVSKLYAMINDPKSSQFISWKEDGSSFIVSNIGEFSRSILGSHFKHNNFSSFVRQLNMYGFHKINRTPRASRPPLQTWEFSHPRFIRGRPDLLDDIKRKALVDGVLNPNSSISPSSGSGGIHGGQTGDEVCRQLEENRTALKVEREKVEKLVGVVRILWEVVERAIPGSIPIPFPSDLFDTDHYPPILITTHSDEEEADDTSQSQPQPQPQPQPQSQQPQPQPQPNLSLSLSDLRYNASLSLQSSPCSSPTTGELSRPHSHPPPISINIPTEPHQYAQAHQSHPHPHLPPPPQISYPSSPSDPGRLHPLHGHNDMHSHHPHIHTHELHPHSHPELHPHAHSQSPHPHHNTVEPAQKRQRLRSDSAPLRSGLDGSGASGNGDTLSWINHSATAGGGVYQMSRSIGRPRSGSNLIGNGSGSGNVRSNVGVWYGTGTGTGMGGIKDENR